MKRLVLPFLLAALFAAPTAYASCFWSHIDHRVALDDSGAWKASSYRTVSNTLTVLNVAGALWEGTESRIGRTMWEGAESEVLGEGVALAAKPIFGRMRPSATDDPCRWFKGSGNKSFPSEEATDAMALVTPYVLEYAHDQPAVYALLLLPAYVGIGRVKNQGHWQSDVLAGWAIGGAIGWWEHGRARPLVFGLLPGGGWVGLRRSF